MVDDFITSFDGCSGVTVDSGTVSQHKGATRMTCKLVASKAQSRVRLTRAGRTYAAGTLVSLRATRRVPAGDYTLRYRAGGRSVAIAVTLP